MLTRKELAQELKVHANTVDNMRKRGMPCYESNGVVRFDLDEVKEWLKGDK